MVAVSPFSSFSKAGSDTKKRGDESNEQELEQDTLHSATCIALDFPVLHYAQTQSMLDGKTLNPDATRR